MHRAQQRSATQTRERRHQLAHEAARLMLESGLRDYQQAKTKAASRLGIHDDASLPRNSEIEEALREHQRLFAGPAQGHALLERRQAALHALQFLHAFSPRLVGPVLDGTADGNSPVQLHVYSDDPDAVQWFLEEHRIPAQSRSRVMRMDKQRTLDVSVWAFMADGLSFELVVLPYDALRQAPLSVVDEKPMRRASASQLQALLNQDEFRLPPAR